jgi:deoxyribonuclease V
VTFDAWAAATPTARKTVMIEHVEPYEPGAFYRRELPCLAAVLARAPAAPEVIVVDGYVWLGAGCTPGLGAHLYEALGRAVPVVGVAKTRFRGATHAVEVRRGTAVKPLYVTAAGMTAEEAAKHVAEMHGDFRLPSLLKAADRLCRG